MLRYDKYNCNIRSYHSIYYKFRILKKINFRLSDNSPLIVDFSKKIVFFAPLNSSKLVHVIGHLDILRLAYFITMSNLGNLIYEINKETFCSITSSWLRKVGNQIQSGLFRFGLTRNILIPKIGRSDTKLVIIVSPYERLVQEAIQIVIQEVLESILLDTSNTLCLESNHHTTLRLLNFASYKSKLILKINLIQRCDPVLYNSFLVLLIGFITCTKTYTLIKSSTNSLTTICLALYSRKASTVQRSSLTSMFFNAYFCMLDLFINELSFHVINNRSTMQLNYFHDTNIFLIFFVGNYQITRSVMRRIFEFLAYKLCVSLYDKKVDVYSFYNKVCVLNTIILKNCNFIQKNSTVLINVKSQNFNRQTLISHNCEIPRKKLINRLVYCNYLRWSNNSNCAVPTSLRFLINLDHYDILSFYNYIIYAIIRYYSLLNHLKPLFNVIYGLRTSCALTLALRYKLRTVGKTFKKFGTGLTCPKSKIEIYKL